MHPRACPVRPADRSPTRRPLRFAARRCAPLFAALACLWGCPAPGGGDGTATSTGSETSAPSETTGDTTTATTGTSTTDDTAPTGTTGTDSDSTSGGVDGPCIDRGCHYECYDTNDCAFEDYDPTPWACELPDICPPVDAGADEFDPAAYTEAAHCLLQALRDGTAGRVRFSNQVIDGELGEIGPQGFIHLLPGRKVVIDYTRLQAAGLSGCYHPQRSKVLDLVPADQPIFTDCLASDDINQLKECTGVGYPNSVLAFPWLAGTCTESTDACP